jgi:hypothetical protein
MAQLNERDLAHPRMSNGDYIVRASFTELE